MFCVTKKTVAVLLSCFLFCLAHNARALDYFATVPEGWRTEVIEFPLGFAPDLPLKGKLELLFSPGMFTEGAEDFWSYNFIWAIRGSDRPQREAMEKLLEEYYYGLQTAVSKKALTDPVSVTLESQSPCAGNWRYRGHAQWTEPFRSKAAQRLNLDITLINRGDNTGWYAVFSASPQAADHAVWQTLKRYRAQAKD